MSGFFFSDFKIRHWLVMTRINSAIPVQCLTDEHLLAEHREIKRLPYCLQKAIESGSINKIPEKFTLGKGHVTFFIDKQYFCICRYISIYSELKKRNFNPTYFTINWYGVDWDNYGADYKPTAEERALLTERITKRIMNSHKKVWHYYGKPITKEEAVELLASGT